MKLMKYLLSLLFLPVLSFAGIQDGREIPDVVVLKNTSSSPIMVNNTVIKPNHEKIVTPDTSGMLTIYNNSYKYEISCPRPEPESPICEIFTSAYLDFNTVQFLAHTKESKGLDEIRIINDSLYKIALIYSLNQVRSQPKVVEPQDEASKVVHMSINKNHDQPGILYLIDHEKKDYKVCFNRRIHQPEKFHTADWRSEKLSASTIIWFGKGFEVAATSL